MFNAYCLLGWDQVLSLKVRPLHECEAWLDLVYDIYPPSQIVSSWIRPANG